MNLPKASLMVLEISKNESPNETIGIHSIFEFVLHYEYILNGRYLEVTTKIGIIPEIHSVRINK